MGLFDFLKKRKKESLNLKDDSLKKILGKWYKLSDIKSMSFGSNLAIVPCDATAIFEKKFPSMLHILGNSNNIRLYLPAADFSTEQKALNYLSDIIVKTEAGYQFSYCIQQGEGLLGMINIYTPDASQANIGIPQWTTDFFIFEVAEGKGIMKEALLRTLYQLNYKIKVSKLYAYIHPANMRALFLITSLPFAIERNPEYSLRNENGTNFKVFSCDLDSIRWTNQ